MTDRISIPALRRAAGLANANRSYRIDPMGNVSGDMLLALVEAVEAAQACVLVQEDEDGKEWVGPRIGEFGKLLRALARFDFGEQT